jgi:hypothetical protein
LVGQRWFVFLQTRAEPSKTVGAGLILSLIIPAAQKALFLRQIAPKRGKTNADGGSTGMNGVLRKLILRGTFFTQLRCFLTGRVCGLAFLPNPAAQFEGVLT